MMDDHKFCYRYAAQQSLIKCDEFCLRFLLEFSQIYKFTKTSRNCDCDCLIPLCIPCPRYSFFPTYCCISLQNVASLKSNIDFLKIPENCDSWLKHDFVRNNFFLA